jgi:hypothetical protein
MEHISFWYSDEFHLLGYSIIAVHKRTEDLLDTIKEVGLKVHGHKNDAVGLNT